MRRWAPGEVVLWTYERDATPVTVVRDDADGLVAWLAPGTPRLTAVPTDGRPLRDRSLTERFTTPRRFAVAPWEGEGILRLERPGRAHSLWRFTHPDGSGRFGGWYVNLEDPMRRSERGVHSHDHLLDVWLDGEGFALWKDEDELEAAVALGLRTGEEAAAYRAEGEAVMASFERRDPPFDGAWVDWRPDPSWTVPTLPPDLAARAGEPAAELGQP